MSRLGIPNRSTVRVDMICQARNYNAIEALLDASDLALKKFTAEIEGETSGRISPMESKACEYLNTYVKIALAIANFIHPKRKAIEVAPQDVTANMTPEQKLDAMKQAVKMLELQMKKPVIDADSR